MLHHPYIQTLVRFVLSFSVLLVMLLLGRLLSSLIPFIPEGIWGLLILFVCLATGVVKKAWILPTARWFNRYMPVFFLPICVGIMNYGELLWSRFAELVLANMLSSLVSLVGIAWLSVRLLKEEGEK